MFTEAEFRPSYVHFRKNKSACLLFQSSHFEEMGLDDSKVLSEADREKLFEMYNKECAISGWHVVCISPVVISKSMLGTYACIRKFLFSCSPLLSSFPDLRQ